MPWRVEVGIGEANPSSEDVVGVVCPVPPVLRPEPCGKRLFVLRGVGLDSRGSLPLPLTDEIDLLVCEPVLVECLETWARDDLVDAPVPFKVELIPLDSV